MDPVDHYLFHICVIEIENEDKLNNCITKSSKRCEFYCSKLKYYF